MHSSVYRFRLGPSDIGERVMVRRSLPESPRPKSPPYGDVLGILVAWADGVLVVRTAGPQGADVPVDQATVVAGRRIPPRPDRS